MGDLSEHFSRSEFACHCGCGFNTPNGELLTKLEILRERIGKPIQIMSGCRCSQHNRNVGGALQSQHTLGNAADIKIEGMSPADVAMEAARILAGKGGIGVYKGFTHVDVRPGGMARWRG